VRDSPLLRQKDLRCFAPGTASERLSHDEAQCLVILRHAWYDTQVTGGDVLHVLDFCDPHSPLPRSVFECDPAPTGVAGRAPAEGVDVMVVDASAGIVITHPDLLISPTRIAESVTCVRRGVVSDRVRSFGGTNKAAMLGNIKVANIA